MEDDKVDDSRVLEAVALLKEAYPVAECALIHKDAWQLLGATILSAQCTDVRVNMVTPDLFAKYPNPQALANANQADVEHIIKSTGFFRQKAQSLISMSQDIVDRFDGKVPVDLEDLITLRGVGRKTANVVIGVVYGGDAMVVDTHVKRLSNLLGWTTEQEPERIERDLMGLIPIEEWTGIGHRLILHGRAVCIANRPRCTECVLNEICPEGKRRIDGLLVRSEAPPARRSTKEAVA